MRVLIVIFFEVKTFIVVSNVADPEKWDGRDVARCVRWVARTFDVRAPRRHLLPSSGFALLQLSQDNWLQVQTFTVLHEQP